MIRKRGTSKSREMKLDYGLYPFSLYIERAERELEQLGNQLMSGQTEFKRADGTTFSLNPRAQRLFAALRRVVEEHGRSSR